MAEAFLQKSAPLEWVPSRTFLSEPSCHQGEVFYLLAYLTCIFHPDSYLGA
jgi:hypothetical protein